MEIPFFVKYGQVIFWTSPVSECQKGFRISSEPHVVIGRVFPPPSCWGWTESCEGDGWIATDGAHTWSFALDRVKASGKCVLQQSKGTTRRCYWEKQGLTEFNDWSGSVLFLFFFSCVINESCITKYRIFKIAITNSSPDLSESSAKSHKKYRDCDMTA